MSAPPPLPPELSTLVSLLRHAVNKTPPDKDLRSADWPTVLTLARQHGVDAFLYPWLATYCPSLFSARAKAPADSAPAAWRALFLASLSATLQRQRQLAEILCACSRAQIDVVPLKGAWLSESVYDDPAQRTMSDLDLLIRADDRDACHAQFIALGYTVKHNTLHSTFAYDQVYYHVAKPCVVELHWQFSSELVPDSPLPDIRAIWHRTVASAILGHVIRQLKPEDQLTHLIQHMVHHAFAMHLRGYLDIALLLRKTGGALDPDLLEALAADWKTGRSLAYMLGLVSDLFAVPLPPALRRFSLDSQKGKGALALHILATLPPAHERTNASMQVRLKHATLYTRLKLVLSSVFMPRPYLEHIYPWCAHRMFGLPLAWLCRLRDIYTRHRTEYTLLLKPSSLSCKHLKNAEMRDELARWLLDDTKKTE